MSVDTGIPPETAELLCTARRRHPDWGVGKLLTISSHGIPASTGRRSPKAGPTKPSTTRRPSRWTPSPRPYPERVAPPPYPGHFEILQIGGAKTFRLHSGQYFLSQALNHEYVGFEEIVAGRWNIVYYETLLGRFDEHTHTITGAPSLKKKC